jgi:hypothetical protein
MMPVTEIFEAELDVLDLLEYKPIITKGYTCIMHIHTFNDEIIIKDLVKSTETNEKGEKIEKNKPAFCRSQTKLICRITPKYPIALEKFDTIQQMGRFTLRDEGRTIAVGKVIKYKPYAKGVVGASNQVTAAATQSMPGKAIIVNQSNDMVYDMETGEMKPKKKELVGIAEGDEEDKE